MYRSEASDGACDDLRRKWQTLAETCPGTVFEERSRVTAGGAWCSRGRRRKNEKGNYASGW